MIFMYKKIIRNCRFINIMLFEFKQRGKSNYKKIVGQRRLKVKRMLKVTLVCRYMSLNKQ